MKALFHARMILLGAVLLSVVTSSGCRSTPRFGQAVGLGGRGPGKLGCEGGACSGPTSHGPGGQTPAELFASMNAGESEREIETEAKKAERIASSPDGPNSLFAPYR